MKEDRKICDRIVMAINSVRPLNVKEKRLDYLYAIFLVVLGIFVPLFSIPWLMTIGKPLIALIVNVFSIGLAAIVGLSRRRKILKSFYQVKDSHNFVTIENGNDRLEDLLGINEVLLCVLPQKDCYIDILYNWLCRRGLIDPGKTETWYRIDTELLEPYLNEESDLSGQKSVLLMTFENRLPDDVARFYAEEGILGVRLLNNIRK